MAKAQGNISAAVDYLNKYLEMYAISFLFLLCCYQNPFFHMTTIRNEMLKQFDISSDLWQIMMPGESLQKSMYPYKCEFKYNSCN